MPPITRYHGAACKTCRRRGKKCTRELPTCKSCEDRGTVCEGYALKWAGLASRGFLVGKEAPKSPRRTSRPASQRSTITDQNVPVFTVPSSSTVQEETGSSRNETRIQHEQATDEQAIDGELPVLEADSAFDAWSPLQPPDLPDCGEEIIDEIIDIPYFPGLSPDTSPTPLYFAQTPIAPVLRPALSFLPIPSELSFILNYHLEEVAAKLCVDNNALSNPYRQYIYPLALQKPALLYACAAMSSVHYSTCQKNDAFLTEALRLRGKALSRLKESMWSSNAALDEGNLATILMLILCDMCMGGYSNFEMYFTLAKNLVDARGPLRSEHNFVEQYISWLDVMSSASTSRKALFSIQDIASLRETPGDWSFDVVPCAADVFDKLQEIVMLHKEGLSGIDLTTHVEDITTRLLLSPRRTERGLPWLHLTEAYRYAVLLYLLLLFERDTDQDEIDWLICSIVQHAKSIPRRSGWSDQLLWPLWHAGLRITDSRRQQWLREMFDDMQLSGGFRNVTSALEALEKIWSDQYSGKYSDLLVEEGLGDMLVI